MGFAKIILLRSLQARCLGAISDSRREEEKDNQEAERGVTNLSENVAPAGRPIWPTKTRIPTTQEKVKERKGRRESQNSSIPMMEIRVIHPMNSGEGKGGHDKGQSKTFAATTENLEEQPVNQQNAPSTEPVGQTKIGVPVGQTKAGIHRIVEVE